MAHRGRSANPGPIDHSVLTQQESHVSENIWNRQDKKVLHVRRSQHYHHATPPAAIFPHLKAAGFMGVAMADYARIDHSLITALVERWRPETHTFHLPPGEATVTLQDVAILMGLPIDGPAVTGPSYLPSWSNLVEELLGVHVTDDDKSIKGGRLRMTWLDKHFHTLPENASNDAIIRFARAYILRLIGGVVFPDLSGSFVHLKHLWLLRDLNVTGTYSWGSACLAYLYRELCKATNHSVKEIGGCCVLLQVWAWERIPKIAPTLTDEASIIHYGFSAHARRWHLPKSFAEVDRFSLEQYRFIFDVLGMDEFRWTPYSGPVSEMIHPSLLEGRDIWTTVVPMIHYALVEWHQPDRVLRQFGLHQMIPNSPMQDEVVHNISVRGTTVRNWEQYHSTYVELWNKRRTHCIVSQPSANLILSKDSEYMKWYRRITRRYLTRLGASLQHMADEASRIHHMCGTREGRDHFSFDDMRDSATSILDALDQAYHCMIGGGSNSLTEPLVEPPQSHDGDASGNNVGDEVDEGAPRRRRRRRRGTPISSSHHTHGY